MALRALLVRTKVEQLKRENEALKGEKKKLTVREAELTAAIEAISGETPENERAAVIAQVDEHEKQEKELEEKLRAKAKELAEAEAELAAIEQRQSTTPPGFGAGAENRRRSAMATMTTMTRSQARVFGQRSAAEVTALCESEPVTEFLTGVRAIVKTKNIRAVNGADILVPVEVLPLIEENVYTQSRLLSIVNVETLNGDGREPISQAAKEAVWTDNCGRINPLSIDFYEERYGSNKLAGLFVICNSALEDSDIDLLATVIRVVSAAIAYSIDKSIVYGTGHNMPLGILPRLAQTARPADYSNKARPWVDLHETNIITVSEASGTSLLQQLILAASVADGKYATGGLSWIMTRKTKLRLLSKLLATSAAGLYLAGIGNEMPIVGGQFVDLPNDMLPEGVIICGYAECYTHVIRRGVVITTSTDVLFFDDQTALKGTTRRDGKPVIAEAFVAIGLDGVAPVTETTFPEDEANQLITAITPSVLTVEVGETKQIKVTPVPFGIRAKFAYRSDNPLAATVDSNGMVTALPAGATYGTYVYIYDASKGTPTEASIPLATTQINIPAVTSGTDNAGTDTGTTGTDDTGTTGTDTGTDDGNG